MKRRQVLKSALCLSIACAALSTTGCLPVFDLPEERLYKQLRSIYDKQFSDIAKNVTSKELKEKLVNKKVILFDGNIDTFRIESLALSDELVGYNKFYYTETELELYALAFILHHPKV